VVPFEFEEYHRQASGRGAFVPIRQYVSDKRSFNPEELDGLGQVSTAALVKLGLNDRSDPMVEMVAKRIINAALAGERDPIKLTEIGAGGR
jgi:hypothetical protein